ncbi:hypothetical protein PQG46_02530 [Aquirufa nivalisilvae]
MSHWRLPHFSFQLAIIGIISLCITCNLTPLKAEDAQGDSSKTVYHISGSALVTQNGISVIPTFTLGKPAAIFDLSVGSEKLAFEPQLRFSLEGKPWSFLFWFRYKAIQTKKFRFTLGIHPSVAFKSTWLYDKTGNPKELLNPTQYLASEFSPSLILSNRFSVGAYYLYSHGMTEGTTNNTHFMTINSSISAIPIVKNTFLRLSPQLFYLIMDNQAGTYATMSLSITNSHLPISISSILNQKINSTIPGNDFVWNIALVYQFQKKFKTL